MYFLMFTAMSAYPWDLGKYLKPMHIVAGLQLAILHVIFFHPHECSIMIRLGVAVSFSENHHITLIFLLPLCHLQNEFAILLRNFSLGSKLLSFTACLRRRYLLIKLCNFLVQLFSHLKKLCGRTVILDIFPQNPSPCHKQTKTAESLHIKGFCCFDLRFYQKECNRDLCHGKSTC
ncbi:Hypothetical protein Tpal_2300 [Trichococcus palustris]|uniref:Uncharacterized protein n=1 Tax=Trichococcus palustris TaxID=140314 RepID=A0A143YU18_9LACT|nr:Hypothetical protein Tpal_2300 [Trichococcus palustris]SFK94185.1 hypothetical protein SAMN04488076_11019 [Trichococcus palustris]